ncbi:MAG: TonB-dependent receptor [Myxococcales bacterium]|nr:TonB-dependent receptor [Myxococcales bacterium]
MPHVAFAATLGLASAPPVDPSPTEAAPRRPFRTVVRPKPAASDAAKRSPGFVTVLEVEGERRAAPRDGLAETLAAAPAVHVRSLGGLGQFGAVSIRGSAPQQVGMFLDGVPLGSSMAGLVDTGEVPIDGISRVEIHRGYVPVAYGASALGGAIDLVSATAEDGARVEGGLGSWWTRRLGARVGLGTKRLRIGVGATYAGSTGDFRFYDDRGTQGSGDDRMSRRSGNAYDRIVAQLRIDVRRGRWRVGVHELAMIRRVGVPGPGSAQAVAARNDQVASRTIVRARREVGGPGGRLEWLLGIGVEGRRFVDPAAEIGVGVDDQRQASVDVYASPRWRTPLWRDAYLGVMADARTEWIAIDQRVARTAGAPDGDAERRRLGIGAGLELEQFLWSDRIHLVPAVRVDAVASAFAVPRGHGEQDDRGRDARVGAASPRMGARAAVLPWLVLRGSVGRYFRAPTLVELFGDRGYFVGNEGLDPERGVVADGGASIEARGRAGSLTGHVAGFWVRSRELIQWISAGSVARPENIAAALVRGLETSWIARSPHDRLELQIHYTFLDARDRSGDPGRDGHALPGRPMHDLFARSSFGWLFHPRGVAVEPRLNYTVELVARTFLDPSGRYVLPPRALQAIGVQAQIAGRVLLALEVRNLLDVRSTTVDIPVAGTRPAPVAISDFIGYPLPGRSVWASARVDFDLPRGRRRRRAT